MKFKKNFTTEKFKEIGNDLAIVMFKFEDTYSHLLEDFEQCEVECNKQWDINNIQKMGDDDDADSNDKNGKKQRKMDTIEAMKERIERFELVDKYMHRAKQDLENYLSSVIKDLVSFNENMENAVSILKLRKDNEDSKQNDENTDLKQQQNNNYQTINSSYGGELIARLQVMYL